MTISITPDAARAILELPELRNSGKRDYNIQKTLEFFTTMYVKPLSEYFDISKSIAVDCACGPGWFSLAYILNGGKKVLAVDIDNKRLSIVQKSAKILGIDNRMEFLNCPLQDLPLQENEVDLFISIETLEHVGKSNIKPAISKIKNSASQGVLITTPNKLFPIIHHDTRLPLIHYLSPHLRKTPAKLLRRSHMDRGNEFLGRVHKI